jgi:hypothetical protein
MTTLARKLNWVEMQGLGADDEPIHSELGASGICDRLVDSDASFSSTILSK